MRTSRAELFRSWHYMPMHEKAIMLRKASFPLQNRFSRARIFMYLENRIWINQFSNIEIRHPRWLLFLRVTRTFNTSRQRSKKTNLKLPTHATLCMCELMEASVTERLAHEQSSFAILCFANDCLSYNPGLWKRASNTWIVIQAPLPKLYGYAIKSAGWMPWH